MSTPDTTAVPREPKLSAAMRYLLLELADDRPAARYRITVRTYEALEKRGLIRYWYATWSRIEAELTNDGRALVAAWRERRGAR